METIMTSKLLLEKTYPNLSAAVELPEDVDKVWEDIVNTGVKGALKVMIWYQATKKEIDAKYKDVHIGTEILHKDYDN
jgi:hypothetical protein